MPYKTDENGVIVSKDGLPVFVNEDGSETAINFESLRSELMSTRSEAKSKKEKIREYAEKLKTYEGLDPEKAKKAIELMSNMDQKKLIEAGDMDAAIRQALENAESKHKGVIEGYEKKTAELSAGLTERDQAINSLMITNQLSNSQYLNHNTNTTPDVRQAILGKNFKVERLENGTFRAVAYDDNGEPIYSPNEPGRLANPEEAIQLLWNRYPNKDVYAKSASSGSGSVGNMGGNGKTTYSKAEWTQMLQNANQAQRAEMAKKIIDKSVTIK